MAGVEEHRSITGAKGKGMQRLPQDALPDGLCADLRIARCQPIDDERDQLRGIGNLRRDHGKAERNGDALARDQQRWLKAGVGSQNGKYRGIVQAGKLIECIAAMHDMVNIAA